MLAARTRRSLGIEHAAYTIILTRAQQLAPRQLSATGSSQPHARQGSIGVRAPHRTRASRSSRAALPSFGRSSSARRDWLPLSDLTIQDDPHAVRRLRHRAWLVIGEEMRAAARATGARMPGAALERGRFDELCKKIKRAGGAEQYNANKKYAEAVAVAAEACAEDTKGQTNICTQALHWKTKEGLVRGGACRGTAGFAHVSCLAEQAKILFAEAEEGYK